MNWVEDLCLIQGATGPKMTKPGKQRAKPAPYKRTRIQFYRFDATGKEVNMEPITKTVYALLRKSSEVVQGMEDDLTETGIDRSTKAVKLPVGQNCTERGMACMIWAVQKAHKTGKLDDFNRIKTVADVLVTTTPRGFKFKQPLMDDMIKICREQVQVPAFRPHLESMLPTNLAAYDHIIKRCGASGASYADERRALALYYPKQLVGHDRSLREKEVWSEKEDPVPAARELCQRMLELFYVADFFAIRWIAYSAVFAIQRFLPMVLLPKDKMKEYMRQAKEAKIHSNPLDTAQLFCAPEGSLFPVESFLADMYRALSEGCNMGGKADIIIRLIQIANQKP